MSPSPRPETSNSWTIGVDFVPESVPGFRARATYFAIDYENRISTPPIGSLATVLIDQSISGPYLTFSPILAEVQRLYALPGFANPGNIPASAIGVIYDGRSQNIATSRTRGIDFYVSYRRPTSFGSLSLSVAAQYLLENELRGASAAAPLSRLDVVFFPPDLRLRGNATLETGNVSSTLSLNYVDSYSNNLLNPRQRVDSWTTLDLALRYRIPSSGGPLRGTSLALNVVNLFDTDPPAITLPGGVGLGYDPANATFRGRSFSITLEKAW